MSVHVIRDYVSFGSASNEFSIECNDAIIDNASNHSIEKSKYDLDKESSVVNESHLFSLSYS